MIDGHTQVQDLDKTEANKALVKAFLDTVLVAGATDQTTRYLNTEKYLQHNPALGDGVTALSAAMAALAQAGTPLKFDRVHKILGEGNFVLAVSEGEFLGKKSAFYDLFRVENGKIVEHWDTIEPIPPQSQWKNSNGKFFNASAP
jgi:predicted SnoaL-like aldol condensation-catalyzing enzyme